MLPGHADSPVSDRGSDRLPLLEQRRVEVSELTRTLSTQSSSDSMSGFSGRPTAHAHRSMAIWSLSVGSCPGWSTCHSARNRALAASIWFDRFENARTRCCTCEISPVAGSIVKPLAVRVATHSVSVTAASWPAALTSVWKRSIVRESRFDQRPSWPRTRVLSRVWVRVRVEGT